MTEWRKGDMVRNPKTGWEWRIDAIQNGWARLVDKNCFVVARPLQELDLFEQVTVETRCTNRSDPCSTL
jgi:hypothetical protein